MSNRPITVPDNLDDLTAELHGIVSLPNILYWGPKNHFNLDDDWELRYFYQIVIREAMKPERLTEFLNKDTLTRIWGELFLPHQVRAAWERAFPELVK